MPTSYNTPAYNQGRPRPSMAGLGGEDFSNVETGGARDARIKHDMAMSALAEEDAQNRVNAGNPMRVAQDAQAVKNYNTSFMNSEPGYRQMATDRKTALYGQETQNQQQTSKTWNAANDFLMPSVRSVYDIKQGDALAQTHAAKTAPVLARNTSQDYAADRRFDSAAVTARGRSTDAVTRAHGQIGGGMVAAGGADAAKAGATYFDERHPAAPVDDDPSVLAFSEIQAQAAADPKRRSVQELAQLAINEGIKIDYDR